MLPEANWFGRTMLVLAGILGAGGVLAAAAASHAGDERVLSAVAIIALTQAPALLVFGLLSPSGWFARSGALLIGGGACLFAGALAVGLTLDDTPVPILAPAGGGAVVFGWIIVAIAGAAGRR